jgi:glycosyltransferase involved in cell wall biosynthesis
MPNKNKILILSDSFQGYGAERMLLWVGKNMAINNFEVVFCSVYDKERHPDVTPKWVSYELGLGRFRKTKLKNIIYYTIALFQIFSIIKKHRFNYTLSFQTPPFLLLLILRSFFNYKIIHSERDDPYYRHSFGGKLKMMLYKYAYKLVFQTEGARGYFGDKVKNKSVIISNPVSIPQEMWNPHEGHLIINVGRLEIYYKRQDVLIKAFSKVIRKYSDSKLLLCGDGRDREKLEALAQEEGLQDKIIFAGKVFNIKERLLESNLFVLSSDTEGIPNALMEAMALGMPVVSTDCSPGGARLLISNGVTGIISPLNNYELLANNILKIFDDENKAKQMGLNARESMKMFNEKEIAEKWQKVFQENY